MDRVSNLGKLLATSSAPTTSTLLGIKETNPPQVYEEIERLKINRKKFQSLEDTARCMWEWKKQGKLNLKNLQEVVLGEIAEYGQKYIEFMKNDPDYSLAEVESGAKDEQRRLTNLLLFKIFKRFPVSLKSFSENPWDLYSLFSLTSMTQRSVSTKIGVHFFLYTKSILTLGTEKHMKHVESALALRDLGCFGLTELSHGSNVQGCITNAVFDERRGNFVIYTPHERGIKFWIGNAAQTANMAVIAANLIVKGKDYGIHMFLVEIRDRVTHNLIPGVTVGDCGEKMGMNGVDNGFIAFRGLRVSRDALLDKITQVDENGVVTTKFDNPNQRFAVQLSALSDGRVKVGIGACVSSLKGICIALRFSAIRRQFGNDIYKELPILEYPSVRNRLLPLLSYALIPFFACRKISNLWFQNSHLILEPSNKVMKELHGLISVLKPLTTQWTVEILNESRKALGGLGYSWYAEIPKMLADLHILVTWEGDNNVLIQQASKFVLKGVQKHAQGQPIGYESLSYLAEDSLDDFKPEFSQAKEYLSMEVLFKLMKLRAKRAAGDAAAYLMQQVANGADKFTAWNKSIPFEMDVSGKLFGELYIFEEALKSIQACQDAQNQKFLSKLLTIFAINRIKEFYLVISENISKEQIRLMNELLLELYDEIKYDAVLCFDGLLMDDEIVRSPFGSKHGNMYEQFLSRILTQRDNFGKSPYWKEIVRARNGMDFET
jgi:acyl-CoA oxidase